MRPLFSTLFCFILLTTLFGEEQPPDWVMAAILRVESSSYYQPDGTVVYVDRKIGKAGERGPWQMTEAAFTDIKKPGESFRALSKDIVLAESCARRYLMWLNKYWGKGNWLRVVMMYNAGPGRISRAYAKRIQDAIAEQK